MDVIEIEGSTHVVMRQSELDEIREGCFREGRIKEYQIYHPIVRRGECGIVPAQCAVSNERYAIRAYSTEEGTLVFDIAFSSIYCPVKLVLFADDAASLRNVLNLFIGDDGGDKDDV